MKNILLILGILILPCGAMAQRDTVAKPDSTTLLQDSTLAEAGEAGGIDASEADTSKDNAAGGWLPMVLAAVGGAVIAFIVLRVAIPRKKGNTPAVKPVTEEAPATESRANPAEVRKLRQEIKNLTAQLETIQAGNEALEKNLGIYKNFDSSYFGEAFRKLIVPMNEAMENGSRKEITEHLMKIMSHFSSLTRYKIAKKQPYDEANIHYLLNQKGNTETAATEISGDTPIDKIPKNIKVLMDMLKEQDSKGLDDSIIAGYKIRNL